VSIDVTSIFKEHANVKEFLSLPVQKVLICILLRILWHVWYLTSTLITL